MSFFKRETPHNHKDYAGLLLSYYTIPRNNRELQQKQWSYKHAQNYTIPRNNRELQLNPPIVQRGKNYTIPRNNRELQREYRKSIGKSIIPYQEIIGNYSGYDVIQHANKLYHTKK